jgi:hypothetical protein
MSGIKPRVETLAQTWTEPAIRGDPTRFCADMRQLLSALGDRIRREDNDLYALVDRLG